MAPLAGYDPETPIPNHYWVWSHAFRIRDVTRREIHHYRLDDLNAMNDHEHIAAYIQRVEELDPDTNYRKRMDYLLEHSIKFDRVEVAIEHERGSIRSQYTRALLASDKAVEFKLTYYTFDPFEGAVLKPTNS